MRLMEFYNPEEDQETEVKFHNTRKHRLTLETLNKLRRYRELKKVEMSEREEFVRVMYKPPASGM